MIAAAASGTGAAFVIVNRAPIRASAGDAEFFVHWTDNLIQQTFTWGRVERVFLQRA